MAKLIRWEDLKPGMTVCEEWQASTGVLKAEIMDIVDADHIRMHYLVSPGVAFFQVTKRSAEFRYWDAAPTLEKREETDWK